MSGHFYNLLWLLLAAFLLGFCLDILNAKIAERRRTGARIRDSTIMSAASNSLVRAAGVLLFGAGCFYGGYSYHIAVISSNIFTRTNLDVIEKYPAGNLQMRERETGQVLYVNPCRSSPVNFLPGMHIKKIRYVQMDGCKLIKNFDYETRPDGRILLGEIADVR